jgi:cell division protein FtsL
MYKPVLAVICIIFGVFVYLWQQTTSTRLGYKVSEMQNEYEKISAENDSLRLKINSILALEKMDRIAKEKQLSKPDEKYVVYID